MKETIENLEEGIKRNSDKGYEIGTMEEAQKFAESRGLDLEKIPVTRSTSEKNLETFEWAPENKKI